MDPPVELQRLELERERLRAELRQRDEELALARERTAAELAEKRRAFSPVSAALLAGMVGLIGTVVGGVLNLGVEKRKQEGSLILEAIKTGDPEAAARNLLFFAETGLVDLSDEQLAALREAADTSASRSPVLPRPAPLFSGDTTILPAGTHRVPASEREVQAIVVHATEAPGDLDAILRYFQSAQRPVSAHYLIGRDGRTVQLVSEAYIAFHTLRAIDPRYTNPTSIGVELVHETGQDYPEEQLDALARLLADVSGRHAIDPAHIRTHAEVAEPPGSRRDGADLDLEAVKTRVARLLRSDRR